MGGALGLVILGFSYIWSGMSAQVGLVVAISLPVRSALFLSPPPPPPLSAPPQCSVVCGNVLDACLIPPDYRLSSLMCLLSCLQIVSCWANLLGGLFPLLSVQMGLNPAVTSAPLMTTCVDSTGLLIYFLVAKVVMGI
jgi:Mg/Co/Ni transporter MgtE